MAHLVGEGEVVDRRPDGNGGLGSELASPTSGLLSVRLGVLDCRREATRLSSTRQRRVTDVVYIPISGRESGESREPFIRFSAAVASCSIENLLVRSTIRSPPSQLDACRITNRTNPIWRLRPVRLSNITRHSSTRPKTENRFFSCSVSMTPLWCQHYAHTTRHT